MQDVQPISNSLVGGRLLLRRINHQDQDNINSSTTNYQILQQHQQQQHHQQQQPQAAALKCPRCDSLNTKFCYYNNYNLSQPRHFCKNCRRYWTKGGVLRNVPVGGGCRKSKRSSKPKSSSMISISSKKTAQNNTNNNNNNNNSNSSSESSSTPPTVNGGALFQIPEVENFGMSSELEPNLFSGDIGGFVNLIYNNENHNNNNNDDKNNSVMVEEGNGTASFSEYLQNHQGVQEWNMEKICGVHQEEDKIGGSIDLVVDPTVRIEDLLQNRGSNVGFTTLDWHLTAGNNNNDDKFDNNHSLYEVPESSTVDHQDYWSQSTTAVHHHQWSDSITSHLPLFLP